MSVPASGQQSKPHPIEREDCGLQPPNFVTPGKPSTVGPILLDVGEEYHGEDCGAAHFCSCNSPPKASDTGAPT